MKNLQKCHKRSFKAIIDDQPTQGKISVGSDGEVYLCQNDKDGRVAKNLLGYKYSWCINRGTPENLVATRVTNFDLVSRDPSTYQDWQEGDLVENDILGIGTIEFRYKNLVILSYNTGDKIIMSSNYTCEELFSKGFRLQLTAEESSQLEIEKEVHLTLAEISEGKGVGVPPHLLRIKE